MSTLSNGSKWPYETNDAKNIIEAILCVISGVAPTGSFENGSTWPYETNDAKDKVEGLLLFMTAFQSVKTSGTSANTKVDALINALATNAVLGAYVKSSNTMTCGSSFSATNDIAAGRDLRTARDIVVNDGTTNDIGVDAVVTTASLVGKTLTIKKGIVTDFS